MTVSPENTVGDIASEFPATIRVFQRLNIEFCCDGRRRLGDLCRERHLPVDEIVAALNEALTTPRGPQTDWATRPLSELAAHIVEAFHDPLRQELPRLHQMALKVQGHRDASRHVLAVVLYELARFRAELEPHMREEEAELFPLIGRLEAGHRTQGDGARFRHLRAALEAEHVGAGHAIQVLRRVTDRYELPSPPCPRVRALYRGTHELEQLMQLHIHLENNVLFPRAAALLPGTGIEG